MCGIAGAVFTQQGAAFDEASKVVAAMVQALGHRGPDGRGVFDGSGIGASRT